jgi:hypothetical protein
VKATTAQLIKSANLHWSDNDESAVHLDPFPNPKEFLIGDLGPLKIAIDCGKPGIGVGPNH